MKFTWFGGATLRIHIGGRIIVTDPDRAPQGVDRSELVSGADRQIDLAAPDPLVPMLDPATWRPQRLPRMIEEGEGLPEVLTLRIADDAILVDAAGEPALVVLAGPRLPRFGRWADDAVIVVCGAGEAIVAATTALLDVARPRLIALAADEQTLDLAIDELREHLQGVPLNSLEPGMALEV